MRFPRRRRHRASVQELIPLEAIVDDVLVLRNGEARAVLQAGCVNFALKSEAEQDAILAAYRRFLNGLGYPLQLLVRVVPTDVERYLQGLSGEAAATPALRRLARDHAAFVRRLARERTLLDRRFYVVVPATAAAARRRPRLARPGGGQPRARADREAQRRQLAFRCEEVAQGLAACGITTDRLGGDALALLWRTALAGTAVAPPPALAPPPVVGDRPVAAGEEDTDA